MSVRSAARDGLAIIAGRGALPRLLAEEAARSQSTYRIVRFAPAPFDWEAGHPVIEAEFEKPGRLFSDLRRAGCDRVVFAGGMTRPSLNPLRFDLKLMRLAPKLLPRLKGGDDDTLRVLATIFEEVGFRMVAAHDILADLVMPAGVQTRAAPNPADRSDAERAARIVAALGSVDVGQAAVVAQGVCLGIESIQGTDVLLRFVRDTATGLRPDPEGARGVLFKGPKPGQDRRMDLPAIGPETVIRASEAGLAGIVLEAGGALLLERSATLSAADAAGLFIWGREPDG